MTMTIVHVFWDDGTVSSYRFDHRREAHSFVNEIHGGGKPARGRARIKARELGASRVTVREVTRAGPA
jgi:hypothetical protein